MFPDEYISCHQTKYGSTLVLSIKIVSSKEKKFLSKIIFFWKLKIFLLPLMIFSQTKSIISRIKGCVIITLLKNMKGKGEIGPHIDL